MKQTVYLDIPSMFKPWLPAASTTQAAAKKLTKQSSTNNFDKFGDGLLKFSKETENAVDDRSVKNAAKELQTQSSTGNFDKFGDDLLKGMHKLLHRENRGETENAIDDNRSLKNAAKELKTQSSINNTDCSEIVDGSEGFITFPGTTSTTIGGIVPCPVSAAHVKKAAKFAVEEHNKTTDANITLKKIVKANMQFLEDSLLFYLTLETLDGDRTVLKEAKVNQCMDGSHEVHIFRNAIYYDKIKELESNLGCNADSSTEGSAQRYQENVATRKRAFFDAHKDEEWLKNKYHPTNLLGVFERRNRKAQEIAKEFLYCLSRGIVNWSPCATAFYSTSKSWETIQPNPYDKAGEKRRKLDIDQDEEREFSAALKAHPVSCLPRRIESDIKQAFALVRKLDIEKGIEDNIMCNINFYGEFNSRSMFQILVFKCIAGERVLYGIELLDALLTYLWRIHGVNYYGMIESDEPKGFRHVRPHGKNHGQASESGTEWEKKLDTFWQKRLSGQLPLEAMIGKEKIDVADVEALDLCVRKIVDENNGWKYGCEAKGCTQLFRSAECVHEHLKIEHPELVMELTSKVRQDLYFHNYMSDPDAPGGTV